MPRRFALLGALLSCALLLGGCFAVQQLPNGQVSVTPLLPGMSPTSTQSPVAGATSGSASANQAQPVSSRPPSMVGAELTSGPWKVIAEKVTMANSLPGGGKPGAGKQLMLIDMGFQNIGWSSALRVLPKQFSLQDASGKTLKPFGTSVTAFNALSVRPVDPRLGRDTTFVYEIPTGSAVYVLTFAPGQGAKGPMRWSVP